MEGLEDSSSSDMGHPLRIGVLEAGRPPEDLAARHGTYPEFVGRWLEPLDATFSSYAILDGAFPATPADADLWVITGSRFAVYEPHDWLPRAEDFIRECHAAGRPMVGICFGHQLIAQAMGGSVRKSEKGWGLGVHRYEVLDWPGDRPPASLHLQAYHQDQVVTPPDGARLIASSDFCPYAGFLYPGFAVSFQAHPEFPEDYAQDLIQARRGVILPVDRADAGLRTVRSGTNAQILLDLLKPLLAERSRQSISSRSGIASASDNAVKTKD